VPPGPENALALGPVLLRNGIAAATEMVRIYVPEPTAAFSRRDTLRPGFARAAAVARRAGFAAVVRPQGGRLASYHEGSVVIDHVVQVPNPHAGLHERFRHFAEMHATVLDRLGVAVRIGEVPGEYCPGEFSLNVGGSSKIAGSAQRVTKDGWLFSTVVQVADSTRIRNVLRDAYRELGYPFDPSTVGAIEEFMPGLTGDRVAEAMLAAYEPKAAERVNELPGALLDEVVREARHLRTPESF